MEEEKKGKKFSVLLILLIIALIVIAVMGIFMFKLNNDKKEIEEAYLLASEQIKKLNEKIDNSQEITDNLVDEETQISNNTDTNQDTKDINVTVEHTSEHILNKFIINGRNVINSMTNVANYSNLKLLNREVNDDLVLVSVRISWIAV